MGKKQIAVIGAGLGGLSASIHLASAGFSVDVYEQSAFPGGKAGRIISEGFTFDTGPSLLTMPFVLEDLFTAAGERMSESLQLVRPEIICKYFYPDTTVINAYSDTSKFASEIELKTKDTAKDLYRYLKYSKRIYDLTSDLFLFNSPSDYRTYLSKKALRALINLRGIDIFRTMHSANSDFFKDPRIIQLFDRYATYNGSNPFEAPATLNIIQHVEYNLGAFLPEDAIYSITDALYKLALKKGVNFIFYSKIEEIVLKGNRAAGVNTGSDERPYHGVISNADVYSTYKMLPESKRLNLEKRIKKLEPSLSGVVFYWGIKGCHEELNLHNVIFSANYSNEFDEIFKKKIIPTDPTIYIYISSKQNSAHAPAGFENWFVMINSPFNAGQFRESDINKIKEKILLKIKRVLGIDLSNKIVYESHLSPLDIEKKTGSFRGSIYGVSSNTRNAAFLRQPNKSKEIKGLYFCGGSVHPGGGIPLVILSGKLAANKLKMDVYD